MKSKSKLGYCDKNILQQYSKYEHSLPLLNIKNNNIFMFLS